MGHAGELQLQEEVLVFRVPLRELVTSEAFSDQHLRVMLRVVELGLRVAEAGTVAGGTSRGG